MFAMALLWLWGSEPALAASEIQLRSTLPVVMVVNGERARRTGMSRMEVEDLEPGLHRVQIKSMFGRVLHDDFIDVPDDTLVEAWWNRGELKVRMVPLSRQGARPIVAPEAGPAEAEELPEEVGPEEVIPDVAPAVVPAVATVPLEAPDAPALPEGVEVVDEGISEGEVEELAEETAAPDALASEATDATVDAAEGTAEEEELVDLASITPAATPTVEAPTQAAEAADLDAPDEQRLRLELKDGSQLEVVHGDTVLRVEVRGGRIILSEGVSEGQQPEASEGPGE